MRRRVEVVESVGEVTGHGLVYGPTKTYERRSVPLPPALAEELAVLLHDRASDREALVFTSPTGAPLRHHNFSEGHFKPAVRRAGLPNGLCFHDHRQTCAALLINSDPPAHPLAVMKRLGHSSITVTSDTYGHLFPALDEALTASMDRSYRAARSSSAQSPAPVTAIEMSAGGSVAGHTRCSS